MIWLLLLNFAFAGCLSDKDVRAQVCAKFCRMDGWDGGIYQEKKKKCGCIRDEPSPIDLQLPLHESLSTKSYSEPEEKKVTPAYDWKRSYDDY